MIVKDDGGLVIRDLVDDTEIAQFLLAHREWSAYALCDLDEPYRKDARYIGALRGGVLTAVLLVFTPRAFTSVVTCGNPDDLTEIMLGAGTLPITGNLLAEDEAQPAIEARYVLSDRVPMLRMTVDARNFLPVPQVDAAVVPLTVAELPLLQGLYDSWSDTAFAPSMLDAGTFFGAIIGDTLVAAAGTHAFSQRYGMGVIGNVYTLPTYRGKGLGRAVTGAVAAALVAAGADTLALNVRQDNTAAIAVYRHLGFTIHQAFFEATITLR